MHVSCGKGHGIEATEKASKTIPYIISEIVTTYYFITRHLPNSSRLAILLTLKPQTRLGSLLSEVLNISYIANLAVKKFVSKLT